MTLATLTAEYIAYRQAGGTDFRSTAQVLGTFCRAVGGGREVVTVEDGALRAFLDGPGPLTRYWHKKHSALLGCYRYAVSRGYLAALPPPLTAPTPKAPASAPAYVYSRAELRRLLDAAGRLRRQRGHLPPRTLQTLLLVLYGAGLRLGEALGLTWADVDLAAGLLTVRDTKFYKSRLVPLGPDLHAVLRRHAGTRGAGGTVFTDRTGQPLLAGTVRRTFRHLCTRAGVRRTDGARYQPRLHDFRHTFAVHRLTAWYQAGADVQRWLPALATYLGHGSLSALQVYLTMTPELLAAAAQRFVQYAFPEAAHA